MSELVKIPFEGPIVEASVIWLHKGTEPGGFGYLQSVRSGILKARYSDPEKSPAAVEYKAMQKFSASSLAQQVVGTVDAVISPPSSYPEHAEPYRRAILAKHPQAIDLSDSVSRKMKVSSGAGASLADVLSSLEYQPGIRLNDFKHIVIVDDIMNRGVTAAALASLLQAQGLSVQCAVTIACPLWLIPKFSQ